MTMLTEKQIHKFAEAVSNDFVNGGIPLNESIHKLAEARKMNDEQIGRVCEASNNLTFNKLFKNRDKTASDRIVEFDIADRNKVLNRMVKSAGVVLDEQRMPKTALHELRPLGDGRYYERRGETGEVDTTKVAAFEMRPTAKTSREKDARTITKTIDYLRHEKIGQDMAYHDKITELKSSFSKLYNDLTFEEFEKRAAALWTTDAAPVLADLRIMMRKPAVNYDYAGIQKTAGWVDDTHPTMQRMKEALDLNKTRNRIDAAVSKLEASL